MPKRAAKSEPEVVVVQTAPPEPTIDDAIAARNLAKRNPHPDPQRSANAKLRSVPAMPLDLTPGAVLGDGPSAKEARTALSGLEQAWNLIREAASSDDVKVADLAKHGQKALETGLAKVDRAEAAVTAQVAAISSSIDAIIMPPQSDEFAGEIRTYWRHQNTDIRNGKQHVKSLSSLIEAVKQDKRTVSAILSAPAYLSGLSDDNMAVLRDQAVSTWAPDQQAKLNEAKASLSRVQKARDRAISFLAPKIRTWAEPESTALANLAKMAGGA